MSDSFEYLVNQLENALLELTTADYVDNYKRRRALKLEAKQQVLRLSQRLAELADRT